MAAYLDWINVMTYDFHGKFYFSHLLYNEYVHMFISSIGGWEAKLVTMLHCTKTMLKQPQMLHHHLFDRDIIVMHLFKVILALVFLVRN